MAVLRKDPSVRKRHLRDLLVLGLPFGGLCALALLSVERYGSTAGFLGFGLAELAVAGVGLVRQERRTRRFACPSCGASLRRDPGKSGGPITFVCSPCDSEWDTGYRESSD